MCQTLAFVLFVGNTISTFSVQNNLISLQSDISLQLQTLLNKVNSQSEAMTGLVDRMEKVSI